MTERTASTAAALIDAAEQRFAAEGIDGASLRAVMRDAEADPGAIHYHFGGRQALAVAVLEGVLGPLNARRLSLLFELESAGGAIAVQDLVEAIIRPDVESAVELDGRGVGRARLIGAVYLHPANFVKAEVERHFGPVAERFMPHLVLAVPNVAPEMLSWRVRWFVFGVIGALMADGDPPTEQVAESLIADLVTSAVGALVAASPDENQIKTKTPTQ